MRNLKLKCVLIFVVFVLWASTLVSCKSANVVPPTTIETTVTNTIKEVIRDTIFKIEKDSSSYKAYLECVNGKVIINPKVKPIFQKGSYLQPPKFSIKDNVLQIDCTAEAQKLFAQWKDVYSEKLRSVLTTKPLLIEKSLSWWQITQIWCGRLFMFLITIFITVSVYRTYKNV